MTLTIYSSAAAAFGQVLLAAGIGPRDLVAASTALAAAGVLFSAMRKVAQIVATLLTAAAAVGSMVLVMIVFCGLFIAAWLMGAPH
jgi:hypothetical protein